MVRYEALDPVLVRVPLRSAPTEPGPAGVTDRLRSLAEDPLLVEAVQLASRSLAEAWRRAVDPERPPPSRRDLWRITTAVVAYRQRAGTRATPFGLFAGVAVARFADRAEARVGTGHRTRTRPDRQWLREVLRRAEPELLSALQVRADDSWSTVGDRAVLPSTSDGERSVRLNPLVAAVLAGAAAAVPGRLLLDRVAAQFPAVPPAGLTGLVHRLVELGFLRTDLDPPSACADPLEHVVARAGRRPELPWAGTLRGIRDRLVDFDRQPPGGRSSLPDIYRAMLAVAPAEYPLHVDTAVDVTVRLPRAVGVEAATAAVALWRMSPPDVGSPRLRDYHRRFLDRYGVDRLVPVPELLSGDRGLGVSPVPPAGPAPVDDPHRSAFLARLAGADTREVVLDAAAVAVLDRGPADPDTAPTSLELHARLLAPSLAALAAGDFRLVVAPDLGTHPVGTSFARFADLLGDDLAGLPVDGTATVAYRPLSARAGNLAAAPPWLPHRIPVSQPAGVPGDLPLGRLAVEATADRLRLVSLDDGRPVRPVVFDLLNTDTVAPAAVAFLRCLAGAGVRAMAPWRWGPGIHRPVLPRVRLGRTILASACWNAVELVDAARGPVDAWPAAVARWRTAWGVPATVLLADRDQRLALDLDDEVHLRILLAQARRGVPTVTERPAGENYHDGWLVGADGPHACELVVPLTRGAPALPPAEPVTPTAARVRVGDHVARPGGPWLYAKVYCAAPRHDDLLGSQVPALLAGVDRWFFVRYADPDPHLRLRFHGTPRTLWSTVLPALHDWCDRLAATGLGGRLVIDSYDPELERYGGPDVMAAVERVFQADSETALALLGHDATVYGALSVSDLLSHLGPDLAERLLEPWGTAPNRRAAYRAARPALAAASVPAGVQPAWDRRRAALDAYRTRLPSTANLDGIALSLAHLHCNRLLGTDREAEAAVLGLAWNLARARSARDRHAQGSARERYTRKTMRQRRSGEIR